jgi:hypothetical protein
MRALVSSSSSSSLLSTSIFSYVGRWGRGTGCLPLLPDSALIFEGVESVTGQLPIREVTRGDCSS